MAQPLSFTSVIEGAAKLPLVRIDRTEFLTKNLSKMCTLAQLQKAIAEGTLHADIPIEKLDKLAKDVINAETIKVTAVSTHTFTIDMFLSTDNPKDINSVLSSHTENSVRIERAETLTNKGL